jgi:hypothetical protein
MVIDTPFKSESGKLYVGTEDSDGRFSGKSISASSGELGSKTYSGIKGTLVAKFVTPFEHTGKTAPLHADIKVEGAGTAFGLGQYLTSLTRAQQRNADADRNDGGEA